jgi:drug/metabolite transporter (DMT)-like permease
VLIDSQPLLVALLARGLFGDAINPVGWLGLLVGLLGILCLGLPAPLLRHWWLMGPEALGEAAWSHGELWMLGAALAMAVGTVISRYACRHSDALAVTGWHMLLGALPLLVGSVLLPVIRSDAPSFWPDWSALQWGLMAYSALFGSAVAYGLFFWFANHGDLTSFASLTFLTPLFALLCAVALLDEQLEPLQWLGAALALVSVVLINRRALIWHPAGAAAEVVP